MYISRPQRSSYYIRDSTSCLFTGTVTPLVFSVCACVAFADLPTCQGAVCPLEGSRGAAVGLRAIPALLTTLLLAVLLR